MPLEHDFNVTADQWETAVFRNATSFRLQKFWQGGRSDAEATTFPEAMTLAAQAMDNPDEPNARVLIYGITDTGRFLALPQKRWPEFLEIWESVHGKTDKA